MNIGEKIQACRRNKNMSQEELGQALLVSRQTISLWETGQTLPTIDNLIRLKEVFGMSLDSILCPEEKESEPNETYDYKRTSEREILFAKFTEDDVISKKDIEISTVSKPKL